MKLKIMQVGEAVLRQQAKTLTAGEIRSRETQELIEWMRETMHDAPGVGLADNLLAQQSLSTALTAVTTAASSAGGYGALDVGTLSASDPSVSYVAGATTSPSTVSVTVTSGSGVGTGTAGASPSGGGSGSIGSAISSAEAAGGAGAGAGGGAGANSGTVTLAARSSNGTCWLVWRGVGSAIWYGAQTDQPSCTAPGLVSTPSAGPVTSSSIGWQPGSFPSP